MSTRHLYITPSVAEALHESQLDALELAGLDCSYQMKTLESSLKLPFAAEESDNCDLVVTTAPDFLAIASHSPKIAQKDLVLLNLGGNTVLKNRLHPVSPCFTVGASTPVILRGVMGSILEFRVGVGHRGPLARLANANGHECFQCEITSSSQRLKVQEQVSQFAKDVIRKHRAQIAQGTAQYAKSISDILDELLMNAIWDANPSMHSLDRSQAIDLEPGCEVNIECACDGTNLSLTVEDKQGTFPQSAVAGPLAYALGLKPTIQVNEGPGGAGLGLFMILQRTSLLSFEVKEAAHTRVTAVMRLDESVREMQARPKTLLLFDEGMLEKPLSAGTPPSSSCAS